MDRYAVIGYPLKHTLSPRIHAAFAKQTGESLTYEALPVSADGFAPGVRVFFAAGGKGVNVTLPFKEEAAAFASTLTPRARKAGAVNTLANREEGIVGDNTDGAGLMNDLARLGLDVAGARVLMLGAGGAARGVLHPLVENTPSLLAIANRTLSRAVALKDMAQAKFVKAFALDDAELADMSWDLILQTTSTSAKGETLSMRKGLFDGVTLAYDMMYGSTLTHFLQQAQAEGAKQVSDGMGMLVQQAAEAFYFWRGVRLSAAHIAAVLHELRTH